MTTKAAFSPEEWKVVLERPPTAGMIVITAARGGMFRETAGMSKAYAEARAEHGDSELLDQIARLPHGRRVADLDGAGYRSGGGEQLPLRLFRTRGSRLLQASQRHGLAYAADVR
jgi:hypothetical protein